MTDCSTFNIEDFNIAGLSTTDYGMFGAGLFVSSSVELAANIPSQPCVNSVATVMMSAYKMLDYYDQYRKNEEEMDLLFLTGYGV